MKRVISTPRLVLLFSYVILMARASAEVSEGLKNAINSHSQQFREARRLNVTTQNIQSQPAQGPGTSYDQNNQGWCGAVQTNIPAGSGTFFAIDNAQWIVPNVRLPPDANGQPLFAVAAWAGIDGTASCPGRILQAGTVSYFKLENGNYNTYVQAWVEWYPAPPTFLDIVVSTGHTVQVSILATSSSQADIQITNLSTGKQISVPLKSPRGDATNLCGLSVEYIVEAAVLASTNARAPLPQFDEFQFANCLAQTTLGATVDLTGASSWTLINQNGKVLATPNIVSATELQVTYVDPLAPSPAPVRHYF